MTEDVTVRRIGAIEAAACADGLVQALADVLIDCVEGGASVSFMLPLPRAKAVAFWRGVVDGVAGGDRVLLVAEDHQSRIVGTVQMIMSLPENQPHRGDIAKMLVHRNARRRGVAQRLMAVKRPSGPSKSSASPTFMPSKTWLVKRPPGISRTCSSITSAAVDGGWPGSGGGLANEKARRQRPGP